MTRRAADKLGVEGYAAGREAARGPNQQLTPPSRFWASIPTSHKPRNSAGVSHPGTCLQALAPSQSLHPPALSTLARTLLRSGSSSIRIHTPRIRRLAFQRVSALPLRGRRARAREAQRYHKERPREKPRAERSQAASGTERAGPRDW